MEQYVNGTWQDYFTIDMTVYNSLLGFINVATVDFFNECKRNELAVRIGTVVSIRATAQRLVGVRHNYVVNCKRKEEPLKRA